MESQTFSNTNPSYLMEETENLSKDDPEQFAKLMSYGKRLQEYTQRGDIDKFHELFCQYEGEKNLLYWHIVKCFKTSLKNKDDGFVDYFLTSLRVDMKHEAFDFILQFFIWNCRLDEFCETAEEDESISKIMESLLDKCKNIDESEEVSCSTPLHIACQAECLPAVEALIKHKADINSVNMKDELPLSIIMKKIEDSEGLSYSRKKRLDLIKEALVKAGAEETWRKHKIDVIY